MAEEIRCHCGRPLHYTDIKKQRFVEKNVKTLGEYVRLTDSQGRTWRVQRHYIALHGIEDKLMDTYGFERIEKTTA